VVTQVQGAGATVSYSYDNDGNQTSTTYPGQTTAMIRTFDNADRLATASDPAGTGPASATPATASR